MLSSLFLVLVLGWLLMTALMYAFQSRLIYFPQRALNATPAAAGLDFRDVFLTTSDGIRLHGWYIPVPGAARTLLFLHGNAGNISHRLDSLRIFHELGLSVFIIDYRGYGRSDGHPDEAGTYRDAQAAWDYLLNEQGLRPRDIVIFGRSLGGGVASWLASRNMPAALIMESTFTSVGDLAADLYPWLPARTLTRIHYPSIDRIQDVNAPVLVVHSMDDELIPYRHGRRLFLAAGEPKSFLRLEGGHNDGFLTSRSAYMPGLQAFLETDP